MMNILFLSSHLPSPNARQAGQKISYYLCQYLAQRHSLHLLSFGTRNEVESCSPESLRIFRSYRVLSVSAGTRLLGVALAPALPLAVATRINITVPQAIRRTLQSKKCDTVIFDHMSMWQYANEAVPGCLRVGIAHDVLSQLWARKAEAYRGISAISAVLEVRRLRTWEKEAAAKLDLVCALNGKDSEVLTEQAGHVPQCVLQPWFSRPSDPNPPLAAREQNSLVFTGAFDRHENVDAAAFALDEILPRVAGAVPQCTFHLAGFASGQFSRRVAHEPRARIAGYVPDLPTFLSRMQIALLPLRLGAGIKIKVLECMAAGLAVVTTPVGAEGIPGRDGVHFVLGRSAGELSRHAIFLLRNPGLRAQIGENAREFIRNNYDFQKSAQEFERMLMWRLSQQQETNRTPQVATQDEPGHVAPYRPEVWGE